MAEQWRTMVGPAREALYEKGEAQPENDYKAVQLAIQLAEDPDRARKAAGFDQDLLTSGLKGLASGTLWGLPNALGMEMPHGAGNRTAYGIGQALGGLLWAPVPGLGAAKLGLGLKGALGLLAGEQALQGGITRWNETPTEVARGEIRPGDEAAVALKDAGLGGLLGLLPGARSLKKAAALGGLAGGAYGVGENLSTGRPWDQDVMVSALFGAGMGGGLHRLLAGRAPSGGPAPAPAPRTAQPEPVPNMGTTVPSQGMPIDQQAILQALAGEEVPLQNLEMLRRSVLARDMDTAAQTAGRTFPTRLESVRTPSGRTVDALHKRGNSPAFYVGVDRATGEFPELSVDEVLQSDKIYRAGRDLKYGIPAGWQPLRSPQLAQRGGGMARVLTEPRDGQVLVDVDGAIMNVPLEEVPGFAQWRQKRQARKEAIDAAREAQTPPDRRQVRTRQGDTDALRSLARVLGQQADLDQPAQQGARILQFPTQPAALAPEEVQPAPMLPGMEEFFTMIRGGQR